MAPTTGLGRYSATTRGAWAMVSTPRKQGSLLWAATLGVTCNCLTRSRSGPGHPRSAKAARLSFFGVLLFSMEGLRGVLWSLSLSHSHFTCVLTTLHGCIWPSYLEDPENRVLGFCLFLMSLTPDICWAQNRQFSAYCESNFKAENGGSLL